MIGIGMVLLWAGYGVGSWGYVLVRGWDIPFKAWFSPLSPYQWPKTGQPPIIPKGVLFPGQVPTVNTSTSATSGGAAGFVEGLGAGAGTSPEGIIKIAEGAASAGQSG